MLIFLRMPTKTKHKIVAHDLNEWAARVVEATTGVKVPHDIVEQEIRKIAEEKAAAKAKDAHEPPKNAAAVALGRLGGLKGGKARAEALSPKKRSEIAKKAAKVRWERKEEIVKLHQKGFTIRQIAKEMNISTDAVKLAMPGIHSEPLAG